MIVYSLFIRSELRRCVCSRPIGTLGPDITRRSVTARAAIGRAGAPELAYCVAARRGLLPQSADSFYVRS